jgi:hypothetical protein
MCVKCGCGKKPGQPGFGKGPKAAGKSGKPAARKGGKKK